MALSEESHAVKAIKLHISTIKSQISITTNNVSSAKSNMDAAIAIYAALRSQLDVSKKELKDVEAKLAEAQQQAAIVNGSNKRRRVSPQPQNNYAGVEVKREEDSGHAYDDETDKEEGDDSTKPRATNNASANCNNQVGRQSTYNNDNTATQTTTNNNKEVSANTTIAAVRQSSSQVIVEGCGKSNHNGMYTKIVGQMYNGAPVYSKGKGYVIYRDSMSMGPNSWFISNWDGNISSIGKCDIGYGSPNNDDSMTPPKSGWVVLTSKTTIGKATSEYWDEINKSMDAALVEESMAKIPDNLPYELGSNSGLSTKKQHP